MWTDGRPTDGLAVRGEQAGGASSEGTQWVSTFAARS